MMTLRELEETVDDEGGTLNGVNRTRESQRSHTAFHSTQSITGRASLLTRDHVQHLSASAALNAYISDFEDSHPLETSLYQRTVEDLLLPRSILSKTVDRSLETGKRDTREEYHLHNVRRIIDESFEEIMRADSERRQNRVVRQNSGIPTEAVDSSISSLPGPDLSGLSRITPVWKSTPLKSQAILPTSTNQQLKTPKKSWMSRDRATELGNRAISPLRVTWGTAAQGGYLSNKRVDRSSMISKRRTKPIAEIDVHDDLDTSEVSNSVKSGGRPPPTWVEELDQSSVTLSSLSHPNYVEESGLGRKENFRGGTLRSPSSISEATLLEEAEGLVRRRLDERQLKKMRAEAMRKQWLQDRRNESHLMKQPHRRKPKLGRTESVTTDDLLKASPYDGLGQRKPEPIANKWQDVVSFPKFREPQGYSDYKLSRTRRNMLSRSDDSIERRAKLQKSGGLLAFSDARGTSRSAPPVSKFSSGAFDALPVRDSQINESMVSQRRHAPHTISSTNTEILVHASPYGYDAPSFAYRNGEMSTFPPANQSCLPNGDDESSSVGASADDLGTIGSVGVTSRVNAVLGRAQRLMDVTTEDLHSRQLTRNRSNPEPGSSAIMDRYLGDCQKTSQQESDICRPLESLKKILFTLQDIEGSQTTEETIGDELSDEEDLPKGVDADLESPPTTHRSELPGSESMNRAMVHLSRLKSLINERGPIGQH